MFIGSIMKNGNNLEGITAAFFMVLDKKSEEDLKVVLKSKSLRSWYIDEENESEATRNTDDTVWEKHRILFEKACSFWLVLASHPEMEGDRFLQNTTSETTQVL
jgi:hypothetical protein